MGSSLRLGSVWLPRENGLVAAWVCQWVGREGTDEKNELKLHGVVTNLEGGAVGEAVVGVSVSAEKGCRAGGGRKSYILGTHRLSKFRCSGTGNYCWGRARQWAAPQSPFKPWMWTQFSRNGVKQRGQRTGVMQSRMLASDCLGSNPTGLLE